MVALCAALCAAATGCATGGPRRATPRQPVRFASDIDAGLTVTMYGDLLDVLPEKPKDEFRLTIEEFLYGPAPAASPLIRNPQGMAVLGDRLLVCDQGRFDVLSVLLDGTGIRSWGQADNKPRCPVDVFVGADSRAYVADTTRCAVLVFGPNGALNDSLSPVDGPSPTYKPCAALLVGDVLFVGNAGGRRIDRWSVTERRWLEPFAGGGREHALISPTGLALHPDGTLLVADAVAGVVHRLTRDGAWQEPVGKPGRADGELIRPKQVACLPTGHILVTDAGRQTVVIYDADGAFVLEIKNTDQWPGFTLPAGVLALDSATADRLRPRLQDRGAPPADELFVVSDAMGAPSLTLFGVTASHANQVANAQ